MGRSPRYCGAADVDKVSGAQSLLQSGEWCDYIALAQGTHFVISLNGVEFKDIQMKVL